MKEERNLLIFTSLFNILIGIIKLIGGVLFHVNALLTDSIYTFSDSITDMIALIGAKLAKKRPTKYHPYGFGRVEYITNLFIGVLMFLVGGFLLVHSFEKNDMIPPLYTLLFVLASILMKAFAVALMKKKNRTLKSPIVEDNIEESRLDVISSLFIGVVILLLTVSDKLPILKYSDMVASLLICVLIFKTAFHLLKNNILNLLGEVDVTPELVEDIKKEMTRVTDDAFISKVELIKYGRYYKAHLVITFDKNCTLKKAKRIQQQVMKELRYYKKISIKIVNVDLELQNK